MKLFYWTEHDWECCSHYAAFADDEDSAKAFVIESIRAGWNIPDDPDQEYLRGAEQDEIASFLNDPKWQLTVHEVAAGVI